MRVQDNLFTYPTASPLRTLFLALLLPPLSGCLPPATRIDGTSHNVVQPAVRATINLNGAIRPPAEVRSGHAIEIGVQRSEFTYHQTLADGMYPVYLDNVAFNSPNVLTNEFTLTYLDALWRYRYFDGKAIGTELLFGFGLSSLGIDIKTTTQHAYSGIDNEGVQFGLGMIWRLAPDASAHMRGSYYLSFNTGIASMKRYEAYYAKAFTNNLALHAGYSYWDVDGTSDNDMSDFRLKFSGPALTLNYALTGGM